MGVGRVISGDILSHIVHSMNSHVRKSWSKSTCCIEKHQEFSNGGSLSQQLLKRFVNL